MPAQDFLKLGVVHAFRGIESLAGEGRARWAVWLHGGAAGKEHEDGKSARSEP